MGEPPYCGLSSYPNCLANTPKFKVLATESPQENMCLNTPDH